MNHPPLLTCNYGRDNFRIAPVRDFNPARDHDSQLPRFRTLLNVPPLHLEIACSSLICLYQYYATLSSPLSVNIPRLALKRCGYAALGYARNSIFRTGCNSMPLSVATPVCPCTRSKKPTPVIRAGVAGIAVWNVGTCVKLPSGGVVRDSGSPAGSG